MQYEKGNVIVKYNLVFKDTYTSDPKGKRPVMIAIATSKDNQYMYFLSLTSQVQKYVDNKNRKVIAENFYIKNTPENKLYKESLINIKNIYKEKIGTKMPVASIEPIEYDKLIEKFVNYQRINPDEYFDEIKENFINIK